jgi:hypothetical protein
MTSFLFFAVFCLAGSLSQGKLLVMEYQDGAQNEEIHFTAVQKIACPQHQDCDLELVSVFTEPQFPSSALKALNIATTVNMSFTLQRPGFGKGGPAAHRSEADQYQQSVSKSHVLYRQEVDFLTETVRETPQALFVTAAGNGVPIGLMQSKGMAITQSSGIYPPAISADNLISVAAIDKTESEFIAAPHSAAIASYSNFGLELVDVAAPVSRDPRGDLLEGSSFAAPYVADVAESLLQIDPTLTTTERKKIILRSCVIPNVERALWASLDLEENGKDSVVHKALYHRKRKVREQLIEGELSDILFVKCGGVVLKSLALNCVQKYKESDKTKDSLNQSCIDSQIETGWLKKVDSIHLTELWRVRSL